MSTPHPKSLRLEVRAETSASPDQVIEIAGKDFSPRRAEIRPSVREARLAVHGRGDSWVEVSDGLTGPARFIRARSRYEWSRPGVVTPRPSSTRTPCCAAARSSCEQVSVKAVAQWRWSWTQISPGQVGTVRICPQPRRRRAALRLDAVAGAEGCREAASAERSDRIRSSEVPRRYGFGLRQLIHPPRPGRDCPSSCFLRVWTSSV